MKTHFWRCRPTMQMAFMVFLLLISNYALSAELNVQRLTWAGVKLVSGETTVLIDAVNTDLWDGNAPEGFVSVEVNTKRRYALITHAHNDHFDAAGLKELLGDRGYVICHESIATYIASRGFRVIPANSWEPVIRGGFVMTAVPAVDGFGSEQVSWVISAAGKRIFHGGDTLWHGRLEDIGLQFGPFDVAFLPINGARVAHDPVIETAAVMSPIQALDAARLLNAAVIVPIHFGLNDPPHYVEVDEPLKSIMKAATRRGQTVQHRQPGESLLW